MFGIKSKKRIEDKLKELENRLIRASHIVEPPKFKYEVGEMVGYYYTYCTPLGFSMYSQGDFEVLKRRYNAKDFQNEYLILVDEKGVFIKESQLCPPYYQSNMTKNTKR